MDVDHLPRPVDIGDFKGQPFLEPKTTGINGNQIGVAVEGGNLGHDPFDFLSGENCGQPFLPFGLGEMKEMPVFLKNMVEEALDARVTDAHGGRRPVADILAMNEVVEEFLLGNEIGGLVEVLDQHTHRASIDFPASLAESAYLHGFIKLYMPLGLEPVILFHFPLLFVMGLVEKKPYKTLYG